MAGRAVRHAGRTVKDGDSWSYTKQIPEPNGKPATATTTVTMIGREQLGRHNGVHMHVVSDIDLKDASAAQTFLFHSKLHAEGDKDTLTVDVQRQRKEEDLIVDVTSLQPLADTIKSDMIYDVTGSDGTTLHFMFHEDGRTQYDYGDGPLSGVIEGANRG